LSVVRWIYWDVLVGSPFLRMRKKAREREGERALAGRM
jgi:hypothetical protein